MTTNILFGGRRKWGEDENRIQSRNNMKGTKVGHGMLERNDPKVKIMGGTKEEGSVKTAVQHKTQKMSKNVGSSMNSQGSQLWLLPPSFLCWATSAIFSVVFPQ